MITLRDLGIVTATLVAGVAFGLLLALHMQDAQQNIGQLANLIGQAFRY